MTSSESEPHVPDFPPIAGSMPDNRPNGGPPKRGRGLLRTLVMALLVAALGFGGGIVGFLYADEYLTTDPPTSTDVSDQGFQPTNDDAMDVDTTPVSDGSTKTPRQIYRTVSPSVVHITASITKSEAGIFGIPQERESEGTGSGFVIDDEGHIVTNAHVVEDADKLTVSFGTDAKDVPATLVGADPSSDIAVIRVDVDAKELEGYKLHPVPFGDSTKLQVGDPVLAIGNPFGLDRTLTTGVVSALQREIPALNDFQISDVIQTDAAVNPGNSGGPLLDGQGRVVGVNSQIQSKTGVFAGVAFAVPSAKVRSVSSELIKDGTVEYAWLGVAGGEITPQVVKEYDLDVDTGVLVGTVSDGSPADKAGISGGREVTDLSSGRTKVEGGDVLVSFDGTTLTSMRQLADLVDARDPGDKVKVVFLHAGNRRSATLTLAERPDDVDPSNG